MQQSMAAVFSLKHRGLAAFATNWTPKPEYSMSAVCMFAQFCEQISSAQIWLFVTFSSCVVVVVAVFGVVGQFLQGSKAQKLNLI
jgi:hypothetical protein